MLKAVTQAFEKAKEVEQWDYKYDYDPLLFDPEWTAQARIASDDLDDMIEMLPYLWCGHDPLTHAFYAGPGLSEIVFFHTNDPIIELRCSAPQELVAVIKIVQEPSRKKDGEFRSVRIREVLQTLLAKLRIHLPEETVEGMPETLGNDYAQQSDERNVQEETVGPELARPVVTPYSRSLHSLRASFQKWEDVTISFLTDDLVRIEIGQFLCKLTFVEMGFKDNRRGDRPDSRWAILRELAAVGEISWNVEIEESTRDKTKNAIKDIRKRLRAVFDTDDDPFFDYRAERAYRPRFKLFDKRPNQDR
jgi:hypothetical protein